MAKEAELSLQADAYPPGTFSYRDPYKTYTIGESLDIMNGVLLNKGYRLVRRQRNLMVMIWETVSHLMWCEDLLENSQNWSLPKSLKTEASTNY